MCNDYLNAFGESSEDMTLYEMVEALYNNIGNSSSKDTDEIYLDMLDNISDLSSYELTGNCAIGWNFICNGGVTASGNRVQRTAEEDGEIWLAGAACSGASCNKSVVLSSGTLLASWSGTARQLSLCQLNMGDVLYAGGTAYTTDSAFTAFMIRLDKPDTVEETEETTE